MALILSLETATRVCSVAVARDGEVLASKWQNEGYSHSEQLSPFVEEVLREAGVATRELDAVAVSKGPGSYTGLRIGVSTAKGLCFGLNVPLIAVDSLQAMALGGVGQVDGEQTNTFIPMIDARRMECYTAVFDGSANPLRETRAEIIEPGIFDDWNTGGNLYFMGDGMPKSREVLSAYSNAKFLDVLPDAVNMAELAEQAYQNNQWEDVAYFEPFYLKDFVAIKPKKLV